MVDKKRTRETDRATRASIMLEMAKPRMARSARIAELNLDAGRIPEHPSATMPGTVSRIVSSPGSNQPEKAQIAVAGADRGYRDLRIENVLTDEHGADVRLKKGSEVQITVTAESNASTTANNKDS
jgi:hypothetical protein